MKQLHTPLPWGYDGDGFDSISAQHCGTDGYTIFPLDEDGVADGHIAELSECHGDEEAEANAAFIVESCNNHYKLKAQVAEFSKGVEMMISAQQSGGDLWWEGYEKLKTAYRNAGFEHGAPWFQEETARLANAEQRL